MSGVFRTVPFRRLFVVIGLFDACLLVVGIGMLLGFVVIGFAMRSVMTIAMFVVARLAICVVVVDILVEHDHFDARVAPTPKRIGRGDLRLIRPCLAQTEAIGIDSLLSEEVHHG